MKLYRIKRLSDGKYFVANSHWPYPGRPSERRGEFSTRGVFFSLERTIKNHLYQFCHNYERGVDARHYSPRPIAGPFWDRLERYEVDCLVVLDSETIKQSAVDFMGVLEAVE